MGKIIFERPLNKSKGKTWLIPFLNAFTDKDFQKMYRKIILNMDLMYVFL